MGASRFALRVPYLRFARILRFARFALRTRVLGRISEASTHLSKWVSILSRWRDLNYTSGRIAVDREFVDIDGGPKGPMGAHGGPWGPMGGPWGLMGGPWGPMGAHGGPMGGPWGPMGAP